jgi:hypothetical protein
MNKKVGLFLIVLGALIIAGIIYFLFFFNTGVNPLAPASEEKRAGLETSGTKGGAKDSASKAIASSTSPENARISSDEAKRGSAARLASMFAERLGSYSNQSGFENFKDLEPSMSDAMKAEAQKTSAELKKLHGNYIEYYAVATKALKTEIINYDESAGRADIKVTAMRQEYKAKNEPRNYYQDLSVGMAMEGKNWKVESAVWSAERKN